MGAPQHLLDGRHEHNVGRRLRIRPEQQVVVLDLAAADATARVISVVLTIAPVVVDLDRLGPDELLAAADELRARGTIVFGSGGHQVEAVVDVLRGVAFSVPASSLRVSLSNLGSAPVEAGAFVTYGQTGQRATFTEYGPRLGAAEDWVLQVPPFATHVEVLGEVDAEKQLELGRGRVGGRWLYGQRSVAGERMAPLPIANGCGQVRVTNPGRAELHPVALFTLAL